MLKFLNKILKPLHLRLVKIPAYVRAAETAASDKSDTSTEETSK
jgi:hypothetical protein